ncbi:hypothetical protein SUDANB95_01963 [Actinosynnema sp. ALI-1.44]
MTAWHCAHIFHYDDETSADLLLDAVRPLLRSIAPVVARAYFLRHWRQGPHVRVCVECSDEDLSTVVRPAVSSTVGGYLRARPSRRAVDEAALLRVHEDLARREFEPGPLRPLLPDGTIRWAPHDRRLHVLHHVEAVDLLEDFHTATNELAFDHLSRVRGGGPATLALDLMLATAHVLWRGVTRGFLSYRAHAEGFLIQAADPARLRAAWEDGYRAHAGRLADRVRALVGALDAGRPPRHVADWLAALAPFRPRAQALLRAGKLTLDSGGEAGRANGWQRENLPHSGFQRLLHDNAAYVRFLREDPDFQGFRLAVNLLYLHLHRVGVGAVDRYYLCHLAANAVEDAMGVSAVDLVSGA